METVLITGASSGIGMELAYQFAKRGYQLILTARREDILSDLAQELKNKYNTDCTVIANDLSEEHSAKALYESIVEKKLQVDILVNNAGFATKGLLEKSDYDKQHREMNLNMISLTELTYFFIKHMSQRKSGMIINISSTAAFNPVPYNAVYAATKAYVLSFSQSIRYEYANKGVKVITICPQATDTHFFDDFDKMSGQMRSTKDVAKTTFKAIKKNKSISPDGFFAKAQYFMHHFMSRKAIVRVTGHIGKSIWGKNDI